MWDVPRDNHGLKTWYREGQVRERLSPWMLLLCAFLLFFIIYLTGAVWPVFVSSRGLRE